MSTETIIIIWLRFNSLFNIFLLYTLVRLYRKIDKCPPDDMTPEVIYSDVTNPLKWSEVKREVYMGRG